MFLVILSVRSCHPSSKKLLVVFLITVLVVCFLFASLKTDDCDSVEKREGGGFFSRFSLYTIYVCVCVRELVCVMVIMFSLIVT